MSPVSDPQEIDGSGYTRGGGDILNYVDQFGVGPVRWILSEPDGRHTTGPVVDGVVFGGKYDGEPATTSAAITWNPSALRADEDRGESAP